MSKSPISSAVEAALTESREETEYETPYQLISQSLRLQPSKTRAELVSLLVKQFGLHEFDAETVARSAADLAQLRDAVRMVRKRRYGQLEVSFIEFDVVTWRILPSVENVRFEGDRAWKPRSAARYSSLGASQPVLTLEADDPKALTAQLRTQVTQIWRSNPHSRSIPMRGIETSGLLSIARIKLGASGVVGVLDATDGFSRTVGAQRGSGVDVLEVLGDLQADAREHRLRSELIGLRDSGEADLDTMEAQVAAARLRCSIMPRAQVIVGYEWLDADGNSSSEEGFAGARRQLVGHIHLEPPLKFTDSTQFALKARIALQALLENGLVPTVAGYGASEVVELLLDGKTDSVEREGELGPDEVLLLAVDALRGASGPSSTSILVNRAIYSLTGKRPARQDRTIMAVDAAMRSNRLSAGQSEADADFVGKRSTMGRALAHSAFNASRLSRRSIHELLTTAVEELRAAERVAGASREAKVGAAAAELGALAVYALVEGVSEPLIVRSGTKASDGTYLPEPPEIMHKMMTNELGLNQLAQAVYDSRARRRMTLVPAGAVAEDVIHEDWDDLSKDHLIAFARGRAWNTSGPGMEDPHARLAALLSMIREKSLELRAIIQEAESVEGSGGSIIVDAEGAAMQAESQDLITMSFTLRNWSDRSARVKEAAADAHEEDSEFSDLEWADDGELEISQ